MTGKLIITWRPDATDGLPSLFSKTSILDISAEVFNHIFDQRGFADLSKWAVAACEIDIEAVADQSAEAQHEHMAEDRPVDLPSGQE